MRLKLPGLAAAALIGSGPLASAAVLVQTASYPPTATNWGTPTAVSLSFPGFSTSRGTLTGIAVSVTQDITGTVQATNKSTRTAAAITTQLKNTFTINLPSVLAGLTTYTGTAYSSTATDGLVPGATGLLHALSGSQTFAYSSATGDNLTQYESPFVIKASDLGSVVVTASNGNGAAAYTDLGELTVRFTYTYTVAIPEPATLLVFGGSLLGLGLVRRRRL